MTKIHAIVLGVVDFFAALIPGFATVCLFLLLTDARVDAVTSRLGFADASIAVVLVASYVVGQTMNAVGSFLLDPLYDVFYEPRRGLLTISATPDDEDGWSGTLAAVARWQVPLAHFIGGAVEKGSRERIAALGVELDSLGSREGGVYQRVRAFLNLTSPTAFGEIERLEAEQKFLRSSTIAAVVIAIVAEQQERSQWWIWLVALFLFTRYVSRRRKTIARAYLYFSLRSIFARADSASPGP